MKKIFVLALALALFLCGCQSQPDDTMLSYDGPYVDLIAVDVPEMADGEVSIIKVDSETGYPVASTITKKNGDKTVQERVFPRFDYEGTETQLRFEDGVLTGARPTDLPLDLEKLMDDSYWETDPETLAAMLADYEAQIAVLPENLIAPLRDAIRRLFFIRRWAADLPGHPASVPVRP